MSLIELIIRDILDNHILMENNNPELFTYNKLKLKEILEKHLKQSEKVVDEINGYTFDCPDCGNHNTNKRECIRCGYKIFNG